jgi:hypothetical protein
MENIKYLIIKTEELDKVDFELVLETSIETVRKSVNETKTFVKWISQDPPFFVNNLTYKEGPYNHSEILEILSTEEWIFPSII